MYAHFLINMSNQIESDEEFARRLQAQELGLADAQTPLMMVNLIALLPKLKILLFLIREQDKILTIIIP